MTTQQTIPVPLLDLKAQYATIKDKVQGAAIDRVSESQHFILGMEFMVTYATCGRTGVIAGITTRTSGGVFYVQSQLKWYCPTNW